MCLQARHSWDFLLACCLAGCGEKDSGSSLQANTSMSEAATMFASIGEYSKVLDYADSKSSSGDLTPEQEAALDNCNLTEDEMTVGNEESRTMSIGGPNCPIVYNLSASLVSSGNQASGNVIIDFKVVDSSFASSTNTQSFHCVANISGLRGDTINLSGSFNCSVQTTDLGLIQLSLAMSMQHSSASTTMELNITAQSNGKVAIAHVYLHNSSGGTQRVEVRINGQAPTEEIDFSGITEIMAL